MVKEPAGICAMGLGGVGWASSGASVKPVVDRIRNANLRTTNTPQGLKPL